MKMLKVNQLVGTFSILLLVEIIGAGKLNAQAVDPCPEILWSKATSAGHMKAFGHSNLVSVHSVHNGQSLRMMDSSGALVWDVLIQQATIQSMAVRDSLGIVVTGSVNSHGILVDGQKYLEHLSSTGFFALKFNAEGKLVWARRGEYTNEPSSDQVILADMDAQGRVCFTGRFRHQFRFDNDSVEAIPHSSGGKNSMFMLRLDSTGELSMLTVYSSNIQNVFTDLRLMGNGDVYIVAKNFGLMDEIGGFTLDGWDVYILKMNQLGFWVWCKKIPGVQLIDIAIENSGTLQFILDVNSPGSTYTLDGHTVSIPSTGYPHLVGKLNTSTGMCTGLNFPDGLKSIYAIEKIRFAPDGSRYFVGYHRTQVGTNVTITGQIVRLSTVGDEIWKTSLSPGRVPLFLGISGDGKLYTRVTSQSGSSPLLFKIEENLMSLEALSDTSMWCGEVIQLTASAENYKSLSWSPAFGLSSTTSPTPFAFPLESADYVVQVENCHAQVMQSEMHLTVKSTFSVTASNDTTINCGGSVLLSAVVDPANPSMEYAWTPQTGLSNSTTQTTLATPSFTTTYQIKATALDGCSATDEVTVVVHNPNPPKVEISSNTGEFQLCNGSLTLKVAGFASYQWSNGQTGEQITVSQPGWYHVVVNDQSGCSGIDSVLVTAPDVKIEAPKGTVFCPGMSNQKLTLTAPANMDSYVWSTGQQTRSIEVSQPGNYTVTVSRKGCSANGSIQTILSNGTASADFGYWADGLSVHFEVISPSINFVSWDFGDGNTSIDHHPVHSYSQTGNYQVTVAVTDVCGKNAEKTRTIVVDGSVDVVQPDGPGLRIYPNPAGDFVMIEMETERTERISILDVNGRVLESVHLDGNLVKINLQHFSPGLYLIVIQSEGLVQTRKLLVE